MSYARPMPTTRKDRDVPRTRLASYETSKRTLDLLVAATILFIVLPLMLLIALAIRLDSKGPVLFTQWRSGCNGNRFRIFKFRSMHVHQDSGVRQARQGDPRVTRVGRFLRKTSLDELPQLLNVLIGDMSLVGPRPHATVHDEEFGKLVVGYLHRYAVKPGITGLAQVGGHRGETPSAETMTQRVELDLAYIERRSLLLDMKILVATVPALMRHPGV